MRHQSQLPIHGMSRVCYCVYEFRKNSKGRKAMTERIKLTKENFGELLKEVTCDEEAEQYLKLKQQILDDQAKAKKFDDCLRNPNEVMQWSGNTISKWHLQIANNELLEQENKKLKKLLEAQS